MFFLQQTLTPEQAHKISDKIIELDPYGFGITLIGMGVVFLSLLMLYVVIANMIRILNKRKSKKVEAVKKEPQKEIDLTGEENAAIAAALHLYLSELHDEESTVLTIKKVARTYSPWSSKIYGLRHFPR